MHDVDLGRLVDDDDDDDVDLASGNGREQFCNHTVGRKHRRRVRAAGGQQSSSREISPATRLKRLNDNRAARLRPLPVESSQSL